MNQKLKIFIDPVIKERFGPEVCWAWRLLLGGIGYSWEEVFHGPSSCDIAYLSDLQKTGTCKLCVKIDMDLWEKRSNLRLGNTRTYEGLSFPIFKNNGTPISAYLKEDDGIICKRDLIFDIFWLITGQEEKYLPKDRHGFFDISKTPFFQKQIFRLGLASEIASWMQDNLKKLGFPGPVPRWPGNKSAAACLSHDVDYPELKRLFQPLLMVRRLGLRGFKLIPTSMQKQRTHWNFASWTEMEKRLGLRSAFYFTPVQGSLMKFLSGIPDPFYDVKSKRFRDLFRYLNDEGFEIGLHASYLAYSSSDKFAAERNILQQCSGQPIHGNRHHYWHLNPEDIESTLQLHDQIGLKYDTSLTHERHIGWRRNFSWPFFPFHQKDRRELRVLQLQTTWMDNHLFGYLKSNPGNRLGTLQELINTTATQGGCFVIDIHNYVFDDVLFPGWKETYMWLLEKIVHRSDFWIGTPGEIADHWTKRYSSIVETSIGLTEGL